ncbi:site-specific integrase [Streptomyces sp. NPDC046866]|uniref:tyrosine-type recombinase/integrase n=1 Tax=Streptomyces sp. NPDC046866 TaxID=3154921 RepID=UPI003454F16D
MSNVVRIADARGSAPEGLLAGWTAWLTSKLDAAWRPGEWDAENLLFTGDPSNPRNAIHKCRHPRCFVTTAAIYCTACSRELRKSGMDPGQFDDEYTPISNRRFNVITECQVPGCQRDRSSQRLCLSHYNLWRHQNPGAPRLAEAVTAWALTQMPYPPHSPCAVRGCGVQSTKKQAVCLRHWNHWKKHVRQREARINDAAAFADWIEHTPPYLGTNSFSLSPCQPAARLELLYVVQRYDLGPTPLRPASVRTNILATAHLPALALALNELPQLHEAITEVGARSFARFIRDELAVAFNLFRGVKETDKATWDFRILDREADRPRTGRRVNQPVDFTTITQPWFRDAVLHWARTTEPESGDLRMAVRACGIASRALATRPGGGHDVTRLGYADMSAIADGFNTSLKLDGTPYSPARRVTLYNCVNDVLEFARRDGAVPGLPSRFVRHPREHRIHVPERDEDEIGKALPEAVIRQLDQHQDTLADGFPYGALTPEEVHALFRTAYIILRDTGRRPLEVAGLDLDCLSYVQGGYELIWHNHKGKRLRRRLPLGDMETVQAIKDWRAIRSRLDIPDRSQPFLFPPIRDGGRFPHLNPGNLARVIRAWADSIPVIFSEEMGPDGTLLPFDPKLVYPYAFRHSFCQRYADAGMPERVLMALMDHKSADTTAGYYRVPAKLKREAIEAIRPLVTDAQGNPAPGGSTLAYSLRSVAVPFGNCVEPSNVKAGGKHCTVRFQCAGCGSYRPDPSYTPAIEDHVRQLKMDRESALAMGVADWVIRNLDDQIRAFRAVINQNKERLMALPEDQRHEVEEASKVLRRLRAGQAAGPVDLPMPILPRPAGGSS